MTVRYVWHDLCDWWFERNGKRNVYAAIVAALLIVGLVVAGETELIEGDRTEEEVTP